MTTISNSEIAAAERVVYAYAKLSKSSIRTSPFDSASFYETVDALSNYQSEEAADIDPEDYNADFKRITDAVGTFDACIVMIVFYTQLMENSYRVTDIARHMKDIGHYIRPLAQLTE